MGTVDERVARVLEQAFRITLTDPGDGASELLYLQSLASEMVMEGAEPPLMVSGDLLERALFAVRRSSTLRPRGCEGRGTAARCSCSASRSP